MKQEKTEEIKENLRRLERENAYLRGRLEALGEKLSSDENEYAAMFSSVFRKTGALQKKTYLGYLLRRLRASLLFRLWDRTRFAVRGFFVAAKVWNFLLGFFALLGVGTQFVLFAGTLLVLVPALFLGTLIFGGLLLFLHLRLNRTIEKMLSEKPEGKIYLFFVSKGNGARPFFRYMVEEAAKKGTIFLVCSSFSDAGYRAFSPLGERIFSVHISYYFSLKTALSGEIIQIY